MAVIAAVSAPLAGLVMALIALFRVKSQQRKDRAEAQTLEADLNKHTANRRIVLERYADDVARYHRDLRRYLLDLVDSGVIDANRIDLTSFPRPPELPEINGSK